MAERPLSSRIEPGTGAQEPIVPARPGVRDLRPDLEEALTVIWQRKWSILVITVFVTGIALFLSGTQTPIYQATTAVLVTPLDLSQDAQSAPLEPNMATEAELADSEAVARLVVEDLGLDETPGAILGSLSVGSPENTEILSLSYSHPSPEEAQRRAQGFAEGYLEYRRETVAETLVISAEAIQREIEVLRDRLNEVEAELARLDENAPQASRLESEASLLQASILQRQLDQLGTPERSAVGSIVQPANFPSSPTSPNHTTNGVFGLFAGLALGVGLAFLRDRLAGRLRTDTQVEAHLGAAVLASVPRIPEWRKRKEAFLVTNTEWRSPSAEAYRILRTNLTSVAASNNAKSILVTSANTGEGKTATAANIAVVFARAGKKVILVSGDMRRPRLHEFFHVRNELGLVDVLSGKVEVEKALISPKPSSPGAATWAGNLKILPSGSKTEAPAELLASDETSTVLKKLEAAADFVIIDAPPVLPVTDALVLARVVDGVLFVMGPRSITADSVSSARQQLDKVEARLLGGVLNGPDPSMLRSYYSY